MSWWEYSLTAQALARSVEFVFSMPVTESDDTRSCNNIIYPPEDEQGTARNMLRIII
jgi:hypothetical protein